jgi:hypothetical protein
VNYEITPEPDALERAAIVAALAAEDAERKTGSAWADALLPRRESEEGEP